MKSKHSSFTILVNILLFTIFLSIFSNIISIIDKVYFLFKNISTQLNTNQSFIEIPSYSVIQLFAFIEILYMIYMLWLLFKFSKITFGDNTDLLFTKKNGKIFEALGNGFLVYSIGIISIILIKTGLENVAFFRELKAYNLNITFSEIFPLIIIAIFIRIISQLIKDGYELRKENDLTI